MVHSQIPQAWQTSHSGGGEFSLAQTHRDKSSADCQQGLANDESVEDKISTAGEYSDGPFMACAGLQSRFKPNQPRLPQLPNKATSYPEHGLQAGSSRPLETNFLLGTLLQRRSEELTASLADINNEIADLERAVELAHPPDDGLPLLEMATSLSLRFHNLGDPCDLNRAIKTYQKLLPTVVKDASTIKLRVACLVNLFNTARWRHDMKGSNAAADLQLAIESGQQALNLLPTADPVRPIFLLALSRAYLRQPTRECIDNAIRVGEEALRLQIDYRSIHVQHLSDLGLAHVLRYMSSPTDHEYDLDIAISMYEQAVGRSELGDTERVELLRRSAWELHERFKSPSRLEAGVKDLDGALRALALRIDSNKPVPDGTLESSTELSLGHFTTGSLWQERFLLTEELGDINTAITSLRTAATFDNSNTGVVLFSLATALTCRFVSMQNLEDLDDAIEILQRSSQLLDKDSHQYGLCLDKLCGIAQLRYQIRFSSDDVDLAVNSGEQAAQLLSGDDNAHGLALAKLCGAYLARFERGKNTTKTKSIKGKEVSQPLNEVNRAIEFAERAAQLISGDMVHSRAQCRAILSEAYEARRQATQSDTDDFESARSADSERTKHHWLVGYLDKADEETKQIWKQLESVTINDVYRGEPPPTWLLQEFSEKIVPPLILKRWGEALHTRFEARELDSRISKSPELDLKNIDAAISKLDQALKELPPNQEAHVRADYLRVLSDALTTRFEASRKQDHPGPGWKKPIGRSTCEATTAALSSALEEAVELVKGDARLHGLFTWRLANALRRRFQLTESSDNRSAALSNFEFVARAVAAPLSCRIAAANAAVDSLMASGDQAGARTLASLGIELLRLVQSQRDTQNPEKILSLYRGMMARAASLWIACGDDAYTSLQLSEIGRGILAGEQINRWYISEFGVSNPSLARQFHELRDQIGKADDIPTNVSKYRPFRGITLKSQSHFGHSVKRHDTLFTEIRQQSGPELYLDTLSEEALTQLAADGPVVVFNVSEIRSDAILITEWHQLSPSRQARPPCLKRKCNGTAVELVLEILGFTETPGEREAWPRVWWVATGILSMLPIHVAGYHDTNPPRTAMDRVVSSYVPTVKALAYARARSRQVEDGQKPRAMLISMRETPNQDDLPSADDEIGCVFSLTGDCVDVSTFEEPTKEDMLGELEQCEIAHFENDPLTAGDIAKLDARSLRGSNCSSMSPNKLPLWKRSWKRFLRGASRGFPGGVEGAYRKLDCTTREIRLLELEPGRRFATIKARLRHVTLASRPTYEALSYTWGSPTDRRPMSLDGFNVTVTANLSTALQHLRYEDRPRVLWVDALCINQNDKDERREQVLIMRDIYEAATKVLAWLGQASEDSDLAMDLVDKWKADKILQRPSHESSAFENLCSRPYWTRIWILQELAFNVIFSRLSGKYQGVDYAEKVIKLSLYSRTRLMNLFDIWQTTVSFSATDERDKIYALLGLMKGTDSAALLPDYRISVAELQRRFAKHLIERSGTLRAIEGNRLPEQPQAQSWLPLWHTNVVSVGECDLRGKFTFGNDARVSANGGYGQAKITFRKNGTVLGVSGLVFDKVEYAAPRFRCEDELLHRNTEFGGGRATMVQHLLARVFCTGTLDTPGISKVPCFDHKLALRKCLSGDFTDSLGRPSERPFRFFGDGIEIGSKDHQFEVMLGTGQVPQDFEPQEPTEKRKMLYCKPLLQGLFAANRDRCFFVTEKGYLGLGPADTKRGDSACILYGGVKPFILRPAGKRQWRLQGDAYVCGIMKGELFRHRVPFTEEEFLLC
ncbi:hypothetical protein DL771_003041 [Monosporascus sp. 5C6A]|nr:hypothetical protein DL771_003041 [Monosporascus sp. 5C6A]